MSILIFGLGIVALSLTGNLVLGQSAGLNAVYASIQNDIEGGDLAEN